MNANFRDMLSALCAAKAEFLIVGAHALAVHGRPRATGDLDVWVRPDPANARRVFAAVAAFGAPLQGMAPADFAALDVVYQIGLPPARIDLMTSLSGLSFEAAWARRLEVEVAGLSVPFLGREDLMANKRATGRPQDLADVAVLEAGDGGSR